MLRRRKSIGLAFAAAFLVYAAQIQATTMLQMSIEDLTERAGTIFMGRALSANPGTIEVGGAELPTMTYRFEIQNLYKGQPSLVKGERAIFEVTMLAAGKQTTLENGIVRFSGFRDAPRIAEGGDYLLFVTPQSNAGLSMTVGLGQGAFKIFSEGGEMQAVNEFNNEGLGVNGSGPVRYVELESKIQTLLGN